ncbi:MAG TPA: ATP synthase F1 subunit delta [Bryobacteraceae bacterium]|nr:ATP synthase F1 subunit delta [Bryobacteraceae bacterium]
MTSSAVVNRYANALVDIVVSPAKGTDGGVDGATAVAQLRSFNAAVQSSADLRTILASPAVSTARKRQVIRRIGQSLGLSRIILNFLLVLSDHRRAAALPDVIGAFEVLLDERLGFVRADVTTALALTSEERDRLSAELGRMAGAQVKLQFLVDSELIGGVTARLGSRVYDGSVRGQLANLERRLAVK